MNQRPPLRMWLIEQASRYPRLYTLCAHIMGSLGLMGLAVSMSHRLGWEFPINASVGLMSTTVLAVSFYALWIQYRVTWILLRAEWKQFRSRRRPDAS